MWLIVCLILLTRILIVVLSSHVDRRVVDCGHPRDHEVLVVAHEMLESTTISLVVPTGFACEMLSMSDQRECYQLVMSARCSTINISKKRMQAKR